MLRTKLQVTIEIDLDNVPGLFFEREDWTKFVEQQMMRGVQHYNPQVTVHSNEVELK